MKEFVQILQYSFNAKKKKRKREHSKEKNVSPDSELEI